MPEDFAALAQEIRQARTVGMVSLGFQPHLPLASGSNQQQADAFVQQHGFQALHNGWIAISPQHAEAVARRLLGFDLAYHSPIADETTTARLARRFLACFAADVRCYTNGTWHEPTRTLNDAVWLGASWTPITTATFDAGIVCLDAQRIGMLWVADED